MQAGKKKVAFGIVVAVLLVAAWSLYRWVTPTRSDAHVSMVSAQPDSSAGSRSTSASAATVTIKPPRLLAPAKVTDQPHSRRDAKTGSISQQLEQPLAGKLIADLEDKANHGDTDAAVLLWHHLQECSTVLSDAISSRIVALQQPDNKMGGEKTDFEMQMWNDLFDNCKNITNEQLNSRYDWLKKAAQEGNEQAQFFYATEGARAFAGTDEASRDPAAWNDYKDTAVNYINELSEKCDPYAIGFLENQFARGGSLFDKNGAKSIYYSNILSLLYNTDVNVSADVVSGLSPEDMDAAANDASSFFASNCQ
jgi:hypothetical protein